MASDDEERFLTLIRENEGRLRRICRVYARDEHAREDLHQEILFQLWRALPTFAGASSPHTWLYRVALNTALADSRRRWTRRETTLDDEPAAAHAFDAPDVDVVDLLDEADRRERLHAGIDTLGDVDKMLVTMYLDDRSYQEMADVLGISESNVGVKLHRIRKTLAVRLATEAR